MNKKLALKILLFVTFPVWVTVLIVLAIIATALGMIWEGVTSIVDPPPRYMSGKRAP